MEFDLPIGSGSEPRQKNSDVVCHKANDPGVGDTEAVGFTYVSRLMDLRGGGIIGHNSLFNFWQVNVGYL